MGSFEFGQLTMHILNVHCANFVEGGLKDWDGCRDALGFEGLLHRREAASLTV